MRSLVDAAVGVAERLRADAPACDEAGRLSAHSWELLHECGILRSLQPTRFGGGEVSLVEFIDATMALAAAAPSAGWVAGVIGVHPWQLALFDERAQQEMWADDPTRMHSSSYNPTGTATAVEGGYELSGRWSFSTGSDHCQGVNLGAVVRGDPGPDTGPPDFRSFLLHSDQYELDHNWHVTGMRGTGSNDIVVERAFVPDYRSQSHADYSGEVQLPGWATNPGSLYRLPWSVVFNMALASSIIGAAQGYVNMWIDENAHRRLGAGKTLADDPFNQRRLADAQWAIDAAVSLLRADAQELTHRAEACDVVTMAERGQYRWHMNRSCEIVSEAIATLHRAASGRTNFNDHPLNRHFYDIQAGLGHAFLIPDPLARSVGGTLLDTNNPEMLL